MDKNSLVSELQTIITPIIRRANRNEKKIRLWENLIAVSTLVISAIILYGITDLWIVYVFGSCTIAAAVLFLNPHSFVFENLLRNELLTKKKIEVERISKKLEELKSLDVGVQIWGKPTQGVGIVQRHFSSHAHSITLENISNSMTRRFDVEVFNLKDDTPIASWDGEDY